MLTARAAIAARMTPTDVRDANRRAQAWHAAHQGMRNRAVPPSDTGREGLIVALGLFWSPCDGRPRAGHLCSAKSRSSGTRSSFFADHNGELLPKSDILESQLATSLEGKDERANKRRNHAGMVPGRPEN